MNIGALVVCGLLWVGAGAWWALSPVAKQWIRSVGEKLPTRTAPLVGPLALFASMAFAIIGAVLITRPFGMAAGRLTMAGWVVAAMTGVAFVSCQTFGAMVVLAKLSPGRETESPPSSSKAQDHEVR